MKPGSEYLASTDELIEEARRGRMFILMDDEDRENEGDLVIPAACANAEAINFMARFGRGLICLAMTGERVEQLGLPLMAQHNTQRTGTAFTVSIEAREGVTTGISAADRAQTIAVAVDPAKGRHDIATPGHVFPLVARDGGVLARAGHTEAAVDFARLAGFSPAGVICEIMNDDGTMARLPDIVTFAQFHGLKVGTIADLIAWRRRRERLVERKLTTGFVSRFGGAFEMVLYANCLTGVEHVALVCGDVRAPEPILVRMHALNVLEDVLGDAQSGHGGELEAAMRRIAQEGRGVVVLIREPTPDSLSARLRARSEAGGGGAELRDYGVGAQILLDLGISDMVLLSNSQRTIVGLDGFGLTVIAREPIDVPSR